MLYRAERRRGWRVVAFGHLRLCHSLLSVHQLSSRGQPGSGGLRTVFSARAAPRAFVIAAVVGGPPPATNRPARTSSVASRRLCSPAVPFGAKCRSRRSLPRPTQRNAPPGDREHSRRFGGKNAATCTARAPPPPPPPPAPKPPNTKRPRARRSTRRATRSRAWHFVRKARWLGVARSASTVVLPRAQILEGFS